MNIQPVLLHSFQFAFVQTFETWTYKQPLILAELRFNIFIPVKCEATGFKDTWGFKRWLSSVRLFEVVYIHTGWMNLGAAAGCIPWWCVQKGFIRFGGCGPVPPELAEWLSPARQSLFIRTHSCRERLPQRFWTPVVQLLSVCTNTRYCSSQRRAESISRQRWLLVLLSELM